MTLATLKQRLAMPSDLVDLADIGELVGITVDSGSLTIGAMTPHALVHASDDVKNGPGTVQAGRPDWRSHGSTGAPSWVDLQQRSGCGLSSAVVGLAQQFTRTNARLPETIFTGMFETALEEDDRYKVSFTPEKAAYMKFPNPASRYAVVGTLVSQGPQGTRLPSPARAHACSASPKWKPLLQRTSRRSSLKVSNRLPT